MAASQCQEPRPLGLHCPLHSCSLLYSQGYCLSSGLHLLLFGLLSWPSFWDYCFMAFQKLISSDYFSKSLNSLPGESQPFKMMVQIHHFFSISSHSLPLYVHRFQTLHKLLLLPGFAKGELPLHLYSVLLLPPHSSRLTLNVISFAKCYLLDELFRLLPTKLNSINI